MYNKRVNLCQSNLQGCAGSTLRTGHGSSLVGANGAEACTDLAPEAEQVKGEGVGSGRGGTQLLLPKHEARGLGIAKDQVLLAASIHLRTRAPRMLNFHKKVAIIGNDVAE